jgi:hypothetical protein
LLPKEDRALFDYGIHAGKTSPAILRMCEANDPWQIFKLVSEHSIDLLAGHVPAKKYVHMFGVANTVTFLRDPMQRVYSEYQHARRINGYRKDFAHFFRSPHNQNRQSKLLQGVVPEALGFVGITERYSESLTAVNEMLGIGIPEIQSNQGRQNLAEFYEFSGETEDELRWLNRQDIHLYEKFDRILSLRTDLRARGLSFVHGRLVKVDPKMVSGWAWFAPLDGISADEPVELELMRNDRVVQTMVAKQYRGGMSMLSPPRAGYVGFSCHHDGKAGDVLSCRVAGSGQVLSPDSVVVPSS